LHNSTNFPLGYSPHTQEKIASAKFFHFEVTSKLLHLVITPKFFHFVGNSFHKQTHIAAGKTHEKSWLITGHPQMHHRKTWTRRMLVLNVCP